LRVEGTSGVDCRCTEPVLTMEQMEAACIDPEWRDYCAHHLVEFDKCRRDHFPWVIACAPQKHAWQQCQVEEYVLYTFVLSAVVVWPPRLEFVQFLWENAVFGWVFAWYICIFIYGFTVGTDWN